MIDAPKQDWKYYEEKTKNADVEWMRRLTIAQRFALYCNMFNLIHKSRDSAIDLEILERYRWERKLAARNREVEVYRKLDELRGRTTQSDTESRR